MDTHSDVEYETIITRITSFTDRLYKKVSFIVSIDTHDVNNSDDYYDSFCGLSLTYFHIYIPHFATTEILVQTKSDPIKSNV